MLDGVKQLGKNVAAALDHRPESIQGTLGLLAMAALELLQPVHLKLLAAARSAHDFNRRNAGFGFNITIQAYDGPEALIDLPFVTQRRGLNLTALVAKFGCGQHTAKVVNSAKFIQHGLFD